MGADARGCGRNESRTAWSSARRGWVVGQPSSLGQRGMAGVSPAPLSDPGVQAQPLLPQIQGFSILTPPSLDPGVLSAASPPSDTGVHPLLPQIQRFGPPAPPPSDPVIQVPSHSFCGHRSPAPSPLWSYISGIPAPQAPEAQAPSAHSPHVSN